MIPLETQCGIYTVVVVPGVNVVAILKQGPVTRQNVKSFNVGEDGDTLQECYDKAVAEASQL